MPQRFWASSSLNSELMTWPDKANMKILSIRLPFIRNSQLMSTFADSTDAWSHNQRRVSELLLLCKYIVCLLFWVNIQLGKQRKIGHFPESRSLWIECIQWEEESNERRPSCLHVADARQVFLRHQLAQSLASRMCGFVQPPGCWGRFELLVVHVCVERPIIDRCSAIIGVGSCSKWSAETIIDLHVSQRSNLN